jgi:hypothetical protein
MRINYLRVIVGDFINPLSIMNEITKWKMNNELEDFSNILTPL